MKTSVILMLLILSFAFGFDCKKLSSVTDEYLQTPQTTKDEELFAAIEANDKTKVEELLKQSANPNAFEQSYYKNADGNLEKTKFYDTALGNAVNLKQVEIARLLLEHGADVNKGTFSLDKNGQEDYNSSNIKQAVIKQDIPMIKLLIEYHSNLKGGFEPLIFSAKNKEVTDLLVENGVDINEQDSAGYTFLIRAVIENNVELVKIALEHNPKLNLKLKPVIKLYNFRELTALGMAKTWTRENPDENLKQKEIIKLLKEAGAKK